MMKAKNKKVICAMSGGVDSSVAAALLKRKGFLPGGRQGNVIGVFMKFWSPLRDSSPINADNNADLRGYNRCCSPEAEARARKVASRLEIPFYVFNFEKEFKKAVVDYFLKEYKKGRTPNPCVVCNKKIKFGLLLKKALALKGDFVATGHYARIKKQGDSFKLYRGKDKNKDQSYFLWQLNQKQLKRILFPIGDYQMEEVEKLAKKMNLPVSKEKESQEICFIPETINDFLKKRLKPKPGKIVTVDGQKIGEHQGLYLYTIGQRKGIGLSGGPWYVLDKDLKKNNLIITKNEEDLMKKELIAEKANWILKEPKFPLKVKAKIRYRHQPALATIYEIEPKVYSLKFKVAQRAITPGQSVVFYKDGEVLGGAIISK